MVSFFTNLMLCEVQRCLWMCHPQPEAKHSLPLTITKPDYCLPPGPKESTQNSSFGVSLCVSTRGPQMRPLPQERLRAAQRSSPRQWHTTSEGSLSRVSPALVLLSVGARVQGSLLLSLYKSHVTSKGSKSSPRKKKFGLWRRVLVHCVQYN